jgi:hypothetical protein
LILQEVLILAGNRFLAGIDSSCMKISSDTLH